MLVLEEKKTLLLTGISGFVGHHVFEQVMKTTNWDVVGLHRSSRAGSLLRLQEVLKEHPEWKNRLKLLWHDLRDTITPNLSARIGVIDYVFHIAASSHVDDSIRDPVKYVFDNVLGTVNLLEWARNNDDIERFIYFSTDEVYGNALMGENHVEGSPHKPRNPYAASKASAEDFCNAYFVTFDVPIIITNTMNIIGERQLSEKYVPLVINSLLNEEKLLIHGYPDKTRAGSRKYLHARNAAAALLFIAVKGVVGEKYNIVGEEEIDNLEMAQLITEYVNEYTGGKTNLWYEIVDFHSSRPGHDLRYSLDGSKLKELGYEHPVGFRESLKKTVEWTLKNRRWLI